MTCITQIPNTIGHWMPRIHDALTVAPQANQLANWGLSAPVAGEPNWRTWQVHTLDQQECQAALTEARAAANWEHLRAITLAVGGVLVSFAVYALMLAVAGAIIVYSMAALTAFSAYLESISWVLDCIITIPGIVWWDIMVLNIGLRIAAFAPRLWTKELIPAISRTWNHGDHLDLEVVRLELRLAHLNAWA